MLTKNLLNMLPPHYNETHTPCIVYIIYTYIGRTMPEHDLAGGRRSRINHGSVRKSYMNTSDTVIDAAAATRWCVICALHGYRMAHTYIHNTLHRGVFKCAWNALSHTSARRDPPHPTPCLPQQTRVYTSYNNVYTTWIPGTYTYMRLYMWRLLRAHVRYIRHDN